MILVAVAIFLWWSGNVSQVVGIALVAGAAVLEVVEVWLWITYLKRFKVQSGREAMIGKTAEVVRRCDPDGTVRFMGELWSCRCELGAEAGSRVEIVEVRGLTLIVKP